MLTYSVYFRASSMPTLESWRDALSTADFPVTIADYSLDNKESEAIAGWYREQTFYFGLSVTPVVDAKPAAVPHADRVAVFQSDVFNGLPEPTVMLAAAFAIASAGWLCNEQNDEWLPPADAAAYARWFAELPYDAEE